MNLFQRLILPYTRAELPGWGPLMERACVLGGKFDSLWKGSSLETIRGKRHGYLMTLDLSNWSERMTFFLGRYYELGVQLALDATLNPGDRFVDIGANVGMITLHARSRVGDHGQIDAFEPNPACVKKLEDQLRINGISNVEVHPCALSDTRGELTLTMTSDHTGTATLAAVKNRGDVVQAIDVNVAVGDELLASGPPVNVIKIDVEGFELHALRGLDETITRSMPHVITELIEDQLKRANASVKEVAELMFQHGYNPFGISHRRHTLTHVLALHPLQSNGSFGRFKDVLWVHPNNPQPLDQFVVS